MGPKLSGLFYTFLKGTAFSAGIMVTALVAIDIDTSTYPWQSFETGELLTAENLNNNMNGLKDALSKINLTYSTSEVDTGQTWIDGNKIYRKVILINSLPNGPVNVTLSIPHNITSFDKIVKIYGFAQAPGGTFITIPRSDVNTIAANIDVYIGTTSINIVVNPVHDLSTYTAHITLEYTKP